MLPDTWLVGACDSRSYQNRLIVISEWWRASPTNGCLVFCEVGRIAVAFSYVSMITCRACRHLLRPTKYQKCFNNPVFTSPVRWRTDATAKDTERLPLAGVRVLDMTRVLAGVGDQFWTSSDVTYTEDSHKALCNTNSGWPRVCIDNSNMSMRLPSKGSSVNKT